jgi:carboxyl-terminal processing protease
VATRDEALLGMRACDAYVLDLRGNTGGDGSMAAAVAGHFFGRRTSLGSMRTRHGAGELEVVPRLAFGDERAAPFRGPVAILVDETTGSTSEVFTGGMQALGRARVFGGRTAGAVLPATLTELPNGDSLLHAIAEFTTPSGDVLEERGVLPDEPVAPTRAGFADGEDVVLAAALSWIAERADG